MTARQVSKRVIERLLRLAPRSPRHMRGRSLILAYHNIVPDGLEGLGEQSLHLRLGAFTRQLDLLQRSCRIVTLTELLSGARSDDGPVVAITFDDAYRGAVELGLPELANRGIPSTLFVAPGLLGSSSFWWDEMAGSAGGLSVEVRSRILEVEAGRPGRLGTAAPLPRWYGCADRTQIVALAGLGLVTLGAHTWTHPNLARIDPGELSEELNRPLDWLRTTGVPMVSVLAYPYGLSTPAVEVATARAGYVAAVRIEGGWFHGDGGSWRTPRFNVPAGLSEDGLMLRLSGVLRIAPGGTGQ